MSTCPVFDLADFQILASSSKQLGWCWCWCIFEFYICEIYNLAAKDPAGGQESSLFVGLFVYTELFQNLKISRKKPQNVVVFARSACIFEGSMHSQNKNGWMKMIDVGNTYFDTLLLLNGTTR